MNQKSDSWRVLMNPPRRTTDAQMNPSTPRLVAAFSRMDRRIASTVSFFSGARRMANSANFFAGAHELAELVFARGLYSGKEPKLLLGFCSMICNEKFSSLSARSELSWFMCFMFTRP
ncbi:hypothetical protein Sjap_006667 [Stephania japonica]|uniref:Uncharacterized protein n=1 Tax=Stephania japonica TaxID=461633 RepID=A0AAP0K847_9MAGN